MNLPPLDSNEIERVLSLLFTPAAVVECRLYGALKSNKAVVAGFYDDHAKLSGDLNRYRSARAIYVTLNEVNPALLARAANRLAEYADGLTTDAHILRRRWLLVDCDPQRPADISSTDDEHRAGIARCKAVARTLRDDAGWPDPIFGDSGNGGHLLYRLDLPNDETSTALITRCLKALAARFDDDAVKVDQVVFNASRISKLYGTWARKGDDIPERPHRLSSVLFAPPEVAVVPVELLHALADTAPPDENRHALRAPGGANRSAARGSSARTPAFAGPFDMEAWLARVGLVTDAPESYQGGQKWQLDCPFNPDHKRPDAVLFVTPSGAAAFRCSHNSCSGNDWHALRDLLEPGWREANAHRTTGMREPRKKATPPKAGTASGTGTPAAAEPEEETGGGNAATRMVEMIRASAQLWHTPERTTFATLPIADEVQTWPLKSLGFERLLCDLYFDTTEKAPSATAVSDACRVLDALAANRGPEFEAHVRKAYRVGSDGPEIYLDLGNEKWEVVRVTAAGWQVMPQSIDLPVRFRRAQGQLPLPTPLPGGDIEDLRQFVNVRTPSLLKAEGEEPDDPETVAETDEYPLMVAWLLAALGPHRPYPLLNLSGEQGSAKSSTARVLRALVDPAKPALRPEPKDERDIAIHANASFTIAFDNLSVMHQWLSDALCRVATGGGLGTRRLYTDDEETLFDFMRPVILTGIGEPAKQPDLLERSLLLTLPSIPEEKRRDEEEVALAFEAARPRILGALLDIVSIGLANVATVRLPRRPRMADFARWVSACEPGCPWPLGTFLDTYEQNRAEATAVGLESSNIAPLILKLLSRIAIDTHTNAPVWDGTAGELLEELLNHAEDRDRKRLPANARALSFALKRIIPNLRDTGVLVEHKRTEKARTIRITRKDRLRSALRHDAKHDANMTQTHDAKKAVSAGIPSRSASGMTHDANLPITNSLEGMEKSGITQESCNTGVENRVTPDFASLRHAEEPEAFSAEDGEEF
jgi:hypothetical protein